MQYVWQNFWYEGIKPYKCEDCDYIFSIESKLKTHVASVHGGKKPFKCEVCDYTCALKGNLKKHIASVHGGEKAF